MRLHASIQEIESALPYAAMLASSLIARASPADVRPVLTYLVPILTHTRVHVDTHLESILAQCPSALPRPRAHPFIIITTIVTTTTASTSLAHTFSRCISNSHPSTPAGAASGQILQAGARGPSSSANSGSPWAPGGEQRGCSGRRGAAPGVRAAADGGS